MEEEIKKTEKWENDTIINPGDEYSREQEDKNRKIKMIGEIILYVLLAVGIAVYVSISYLYPEKDLWASLWVVMLIGPIFSSMYSAIAHGRMTEFLYPLFCTGIYCSIGYVYNLWHPLWIIFLTIPVYYILANLVDKIIRKK